MPAPRAGGCQTGDSVQELLIAANPDPGSTLRYLLRIPLGGGMVLRTSDTWPRTKALYCHPVSPDEWPDAPDIVETVPLRSCERRGAAIDIVAARARENRSQLVFTTARGRDVVFWQAPRTRKQARPAVALPSARAAGLAELEILVDAHERYAYRFAAKPVRTTKRALPCGDYGVLVDDTLVAAVERKSLADLISTLTSGRLRYALGELAALPRAAVVVEDRYSQIYKQAHVRPALVSDGLAECQVRWPTVPIVFMETLRSPRSGPTATSPPPTPGRSPSLPLRPASAGSPWRRARSGKARRPQSCAPGRARPGSPSLSAAASPLPSAPPTRRRSAAGIRPRALSSRRSTQARGRLAAAGPLNMRTRWFQLQLVHTSTM